MKSVFSSVRTAKRFLGALPAFWGRHQSALRITLVYCAFGLLWIVLSDRLLLAMAQDVATLSRLQTLKGFLWIGASTGAVFWVARAEFQRRRRGEAENQELERRLQAAQRVESIGRLAGGIAHDFNNLLTVIAGNVEMVLAEQEQHGEASSELLEVRRAAEHARDLTHQLLAFSRQQVLEPEVLELNEVVRDTERLLQRVIGEDIRLTIDLEPKLGRMEADPTQLEQVIMNLAVNARDAMPAGGELRIRTRNVWLDDARAARLPYPIEPGDYVLLEVSDTGHGMDAATAERVFEPFFTTKPPGRGTGLGLATVYGVVKQSGGWIGVESEPGRGTTFRIHFPLVLARPVRKAKGRPGGGATSSTRTGTVLVAEDDRAVRELACKALAQVGFDALPAADGEEALRLLGERGGSVAILVTDAVMPGLGGAEVVRRARERWPDLPCLLMSGYAPGSERHGRAFPQGAPFLEKPFTPAELVAKVREVLER